MTITKDQLSPFIHLRKKLRYKIFSFIICLIFVFQPILSIHNPQLPSTRYSFFYDDFEDREGWAGAFEVKNSKIYIRQEQYAVSPAIPLQWLGMKDLYLATELINYWSDNNGFLSVWDYNQSIQLVSFSTEILRSNRHLDIFEYVTPLTSFIQIKLTGKIAFDSIRVYTNNLYLIDYLAEKESVNTKDYPLVTDPSEIEALYPFARVFSMFPNMQKAFSTRTHFLPFVHSPTLTGLIRIEPQEGQESMCVFSNIHVKINLITINFVTSPTTYTLLDEHLDLSTPLLPISVDLSAYVLHDFYLEVEFQYLNVTGGEIHAYLDELVVVNSYQTDPLNGIVHAYDYLKTFNANIVTIDDDYPVALKQTTTGKMASYLLDTSQGNFSYTFNSPSSLLNFTTNYIKDVNTWSSTSQGLEARGSGYILERYSTLTEFDVSTTLKVLSGKAGLILKGDYFANFKFGIEHTPEGYIAYLDEGGVFKTAFVNKPVGTALTLRIYTSNEGKTFHYFVDNEEVFVLSHQRIKTQVGLFAETGEEIEEGVFVTFWTFNAKCFSEKHFSRIILRARASIQTTLGIYALTIDDYSANFYYRKVGETTISATEDFEYHIVPIKSISPRTPLTFKIEEIKGEFYLSYFILSGVHRFNEHFPAYDYYRKSPNTQIKNQYCLWYPEKDVVYNIPQFIASYDIYFKEGYIGVKAALLASNKQLTLNVLARPLQSTSSFTYIGQIKFIETDNEVHQHWTYANISEGYYEVMFETETFHPIKLESIFTTPLSAYVRAEDYVDVPNSIGWSESFSDKNNNKKTTVDVFSKEIVWSDTPSGSASGEWIDPFTETLFSSPFELENLNIEQTVYKNDELHVYTDEYFMLRYPLSLTNRTSFTVLTELFPVSWMLGLTICSDTVTYFFGIANSTIKIVDFYHPEVVYFSQSLDFQPKQFYVESNDKLDFYYRKADSFIKLVELDVSHASVFAVGLGGIPSTFCKSIFSKFELRYRLNDEFENNSITEEFYDTTGLVTPQLTQNSEGLKLTFTSVPFDNYTYGLISNVPFQKTEIIGTKLAQWETEVSLTPSHESGFVISNVTDAGNDLLLFLTVGIHNGNFSTSFVTRNGIIYPYYTNITQECLFSTFSSPLIKLMLECFQAPDNSYRYIFSYFDPFTGTWNDTFDFIIDTFFQVGIGGTVSINSTTGEDSSSFSYFHSFTYVNASFSKNDYLNTTSIFTDYEFYNIDFYNSSSSELSVYSSDFYAFYLENPHNYLNQTFMDVNWTTTLLLDENAKSGLYFTGSTDNIYLFSACANTTHLFLELYDGLDIQAPPSAKLLLPLENHTDIILSAFYNHINHQLLLYYSYSNRPLQLFSTFYLDLYRFGFGTSITSRHKYVAVFENFSFVATLSSLLNCTSFVSYQQQMYDLRTTDSKLECALSGQELVVYAFENFAFITSVFSLFNDFDGFIVDVGLRSPATHEGIYFSNTTHEFALIINNSTSLSLLDFNTGNFLRNYTLSQPLGDEFTLRLNVTIYTSLEILTGDDATSIELFAYSSWSKIGFVGFNPSSTLTEYRFDYFAVGSLFYDEALGCYVQHAPVTTKGNFTGESISYDYGVFLKGTLNYSLSISILPSLENSAQFLYFEAWGLPSEMRDYNITITLTYVGNVSYTYIYSIKNDSFTPYHINLYRFTTLTTLLGLTFNLPSFTLLRNIQFYSLCGWYPEPIDNSNSYADVVSGNAMHQEINSLSAGEYLTRVISTTDLQMLNLTFEFSDQIIDYTNEWEFPLLTIEFGTVKLDLLWWEYNNSFYNTLAIKYLNETIHPSGNPLVNPLAQYTRYSFQTTNTSWLTAPHTFQLQFDWSKLKIDGMLDGKYYCSLLFSEYLQGNIPIVTLTLHGPPIDSNVSPATITIQNLLFNNIDAPVSGWIGTAEMTLNSWFSSFKGAYLLLSNVKLISRQALSLMTFEATLTGNPLLVSIQDFSASYSCGTLLLPEEIEGQLSLYSVKQTLLTHLVFSHSSSSSIFIEEFSTWKNEDIQVSTLGTERLFGGVLRLNPGNTTYIHLFAPEDYDYYNLHDFLLQVRFAYNLTSINITSEVESRAGVIFEFYGQDERNALEIGIAVRMVEDESYVTPYYRTYYCSQWSEDNFICPQTKYYDTGNITLLISSKYDALANRYIFSTYLNNSYSQFDWFCDQPSAVQFGVSLYGGVNQGEIGIDRIEYQELHTFETDSMFSLTEKALYTSMGHLVLREDEIVKANMLLDSYSSFTTMFTPVYGDFQFDFIDKTSVTISLNVENNRFSFNIYDIDGTWLSQHLYEKVNYGETYVLTVVHQGLTIECYLYPLLDDVPAVPSFQYSTTLTSEYSITIQTFSHSLLFIKQVDNGHTSLNPTETMEHLHALRSGGDLPTYVLQGTVNKVLLLENCAFSNYSLLLSEDLESISFRYYRINGSEDSISIKSATTEVYRLTINDSVISVYSLFSTAGILYTNQSNYLYPETWYEIKFTHNFGVDDLGNRIITYSLFANNIELEHWTQREGSEQSLPFTYNTWATIQFEHTGSKSCIDDVSFITDTNFDNLMGWMTNEYCSVVRDPVHSSANLEILGGVVWGDTVVNLYVDDVWVARDIWKLKGYGSMAGHEVHSFILPKSIDISKPHRYTLKSTGIVEILSLLVTESTSIDTWLATSQPISSSYVPLFPKEYFNGYDQQVGNITLVNTDIQLNGNAISTNLGSYNSYGFQDLELHDCSYFPTIEFFAKGEKGKIVLQILMKNYLTGNEYVPVTINLVFNDEQDTAITEKWDKKVSKLAIADINTDLYYVGATKYRVVPVLSYSYWQYLKQFLTYEYSEDLGQYIYTFDSPHSLPEYQMYETIIGDGSGAGLYLLDTVYGLNEEWLASEDFSYENKYGTTLSQGALSEPIELYFLESVTVTYSLPRLSNNWKYYRVNLDEIVNKIKGTPVEIPSSIPDYTYTTEKVISGVYIAEDKSTGKTIDLRNIQLGDLLHDYSFDNFYTFYYKSYKDSPQELSPPYSDLFVDERYRFYSYNRTIECTKHYIYIYSYSVDKYAPSNNNDFVALSNHNMDSNQYEMILSSDSSFLISSINGKATKLDIGGFPSEDAFVSTANLTTKWIKVESNFSDVPISLDSFINRTIDSTYLYEYASTYLYATAEVFSTISLSTSYPTYVYVDNTLAGSVQQYYGGNLTVPLILSPGKHTLNLMFIIEPYRTDPISYHVELTAPNSLLPSIFEEKKSMINKWIRSSFTTELWENKKTEILYALTNGLPLEGDWYSIRPSDDMEEVFVSFDGVEYDEHSINDSLIRENEGNKIAYVSYMYFTQSISNVLEISIHDIVDENGTHLSGAVIEELYYDDICLISNGQPMVNGFSQFGGNISIADDVSFIRAKHLLEEYRIFHARTNSIGFHQLTIIFNVTTTDSTLDATVRFIGPQTDAITIFTKPQIVVHNFRKTLVNREVYYAQRSLTSPLSLYKPLKTEFDVIYGRWSWIEGSIVPIRDKFVSIANPVPIDAEQKYIRAVLILDHSLAEGSNYEQHKLGQFLIVFENTTLSQSSPSSPSHLLVGQDNILMKNIDTILPNNDYNFLFSAQSNNTVSIHHTVYYVRDGILEEGVKSFTGLNNDLEIRQTYSSFAPIGSTSMTVNISRIRTIRVQERFTKQWLNIPSTSDLFTSLCLYIEHFNSSSFLNSTLNLTYNKIEYTFETNNVLRISNSFVEYLTSSHQVFGFTFDGDFYSYNRSLSSYQYYESAKQGIGILLSVQEENNLVGTNGKDPIHYLLIPGIDYGGYDGFNGIFTNKPIEQNEKEENSIFDNWLTRKLKKWLVDSLDKLGQYLSHQIEKFYGENVARFFRIVGTLAKTAFHLFITGISAILFTLAQIASTLVKLLDLVFGTHLPSNIELNSGTFDERFYRYKLELVKFMYTFLHTMLFGTDIGFMIPKSKAFERSKDTKSLMSPDWIVDTVVAKYNALTDYIYQKTTGIKLFTYENSTESALAGTEQDPTYLRWLNVSKYIAPFGKTYVLNYNSYHDEYGNVLPWKVPSFDDGYLAIILQEKNDDGKYDWNIYLSLDKKMKLPFIPPLVTDLGMATEDVMMIVELILNSNPYLAFAYDIRDALFDPYPIARWISITQIPGDIKAIITHIRTTPGMQLLSSMKKGEKDINEVILNMSKRERKSLEYLQKRKITKYFDEATITTDKRFYALNKYIKDTAITPGKLWQKAVSKAGRATLGGLLFIGFFLSIFLYQVGLQKSSIWCVFKGAKWTMKLLGRIWFPLIKLRGSIILQHYLKTHLETLDSETIITDTFTKFFSEIVQHEEGKLSDVKLTNDEILSFAIGDFIKFLEFNNERIKLFPLERIFSKILPGISASATNKIIDLSEVKDISVTQRKMLAALIVATSFHYILNRDSLMPNDFTKVLYALINKLGQKLKEKGRLLDYKEDFQPIFRELQRQYKSLASKDYEAFFGNMMGYFGAALRQILRPDLSMIDNNNIIKKILVAYALDKLTQISGDFEVGTLQHAFDNLAGRIIDGDTIIHGQIEAKSTTKTDKMVDSVLDYMLKKAHKTLSTDSTYRKTGYNYNSILLDIDPNKKIPAVEGKGWDGVKRWYNKFYYITRLQKLYEKLLEKYPTSDYIQNRIALLKSMRTKIFWLEQYILTKLECAQQTLTSVKMEIFDLLDLPKNPFDPNPNSERLFNNENDIPEHLKVLTLLDEKEQNGQKTYEETTKILLPYVIAELDGRKAKIPIIPTTRVYEGQLTKGVPDKYNYFLLADLRKYEDRDIKRLRSGGKIVDSPYSIFDMDELREKFNVRSFEYDEGIPLKYTDNLALHFLSGTTKCSFTNVNDLIKLTNENTIIVTLQFSTNYETRYVNIEVDKEALIDGIDSYILKEQLIQSLEKLGYNQEDVQRISEQIILDYAVDKKLMFELKTISPYTFTMLSMLPPTNFDDINKNVPIEDFSYYLRLNAITQNNKKLMITIKDRKIDLLTTVDTRAGYDSSYNLNDLIKHEDDATKLFFETYENLIKSKKGTEQFKDADGQISYINYFMLLTLWKRGLISKLENSYSINLKDYLDFIVGNKINLLEAFRDPRTGLASFHSDIFSLIRSGKLIYRTTIPEKNVQDCLVVSRESMQNSKDDFSVSFKDLFIFPSYIEGYQLTKIFEIEISSNNIGNYNSLAHYGMIDYKSTYETPYGGYVFGDNPDLVLVTPYLEQKAFYNLQIIIGGTYAILNQDTTLFSKIIKWIDQEYPSTTRAARYVKFVKEDPAVDSLQIFSRKSLNEIYKIFPDADSKRLQTPSFQLSPKERSIQTLKYLISEVGNNENIKKILKEVYPAKIQGLYVEYIKRTDNIPVETKVGNVLKQGYASTRHDYLKISLFIADSGERINKNTNQNTDEVLQTRNNELFAIDSKDGSIYLNTLIFHKLYIKIKENKPLSENERTLLNTPIMQKILREWERIDKVAKRPKSKDGTPILSSVFEFKKSENWRKLMLNGEDTIKNFVYIRITNAFFQHFSDRNIIEFRNALRSYEETLRINKNTIQFIILIPLTYTKKAKTITPIEIGGVTVLDWIDRNLFQLRDVIFGEEAKRRTLWKDIRTPQELQKVWEDIIELLSVYKQSKKSVFVNDDYGHSPVIECNFRYDTNEEIKKKIAITKLLLNPGKKDAINYDEGTYRYYVMDLFRNPTVILPYTTQSHLVIVRSQDGLKAKLITKYDMIDPKYILVYPSKKFSVIKRIIAAYEYLTSNLLLFESLDVVLPNTVRILSGRTPLPTESFKPKTLDWWFNQQ